MRGSRKRFVVITLISFSITLNICNSWDQVILDRVEAVNLLTDDVDELNIDRKQTREPRFFNKNKYGISTYSMLLIG